MIRYDCMTAEELVLWRTPYRPSDSTPSIPCTDCPMWFHLQEKAAGRCSAKPRVTGRPPVYGSDEERRLARNQRETARRRASSGAQ